MLDLGIGSTLGDCTLTGELGRGGVGIVYRASQRRPERPVAIKVLAPQYAADEHFRHRFEREWNLAAAIRHPNIVPIWGVGEVDGLLYVIMHLVEGRDLGRLLVEDGPVAPARIFRLLAQVAEALDAAHSRRLVHRDVKPQNILVADGTGGEEADFVYLSDFGLTKRQDSRSELTRGHFVGTPSYVAPEQVLGLEDIDGRADVYSLGCVLYEALVGAKPFPRETEYATLHAHVNEPPPTPSDHRPGLPPELDAVIARALAKSPDDRFPTARQLIAAAREVFEPAAGPQEETVVVATPPTEEVEREDVPGDAHDGVGDEAVRERPRTARPLGLPLPVVAAAAGGLAVIVVAIIWLAGLSETQMSAAHEELLALVPAAFAEDCREAEGEATGDGRASMACSAGSGLSVEYTLFADEGSMQAAYVAVRDAQGIVPNLGPCSVADRGEASFSRTGGRHFCYRDDTRRPWIVWSSPSVRVLSAATTTGDRAALVDFVQERAGPDS